ncbi:hypothetical protein [Prauserella alba]|nr:hypothetical protein [Prauserella alba]
MTDPALIDTVLTDPALIDTVLMDPVLSCPAGRAGAEHLWSVQ